MNERDAPDQAPAPAPEDEGGDGAGLDGADGFDAASPPSADFEAFAPSEDFVPSAAVPEPSATFFLLPPLKSVSYQPLPFRRNTGALILRRSLGAPQSGQSTNG